MKGHLKMEINKITHGDCQLVLKELKDEIADLVYFDPPFFTQKVHTLKTRDNSITYEFEDKYNSLEDYLKLIENVLIQCKRVLKDTGSVFLHCDKTASHNIRSILDNVFGADNFQSEIIWSYKRWSNSKKGLLPSHQNIYFYSKTDSFKFNMMFTAYSETTNIDQILQSRTRDEHNKSVYDMHENGQFKHGKEKVGVPLSDVWEIPYLNPKAKERVGYPTQKPLLLLERIIELVTDKDDLVLDPFCGSGTTCVAAKLANRKYIGIDKSQDAVALSNSRILNPIKTESNLLKNGRDSYVNSDKEALGLLLGVPFHPVQRNKGIDAILVEQFEGSPVLVRVQKKNETLAE